MNNYSLWNQAKLPPELTDKLNAIIRRVRIIQLLRGILAVVGVAVASTLAVIAIDAAVTIYSDGIRATISCFGLILVLITGYIALVRPLCDKISPIRMARIIETRHPELQERISSALELILIGGNEAEVGSSQLLDLLVADARTDIAGLSAAKEFRGSSMRPVAFAAVLFLIVQLILLAVRPKDTVLLIARAYAPFARLNNLAARSYAVSPRDIVIVQGETVTFSLTAPGESGSRAELCIERKGEPLSIERMTKRFDLSDGEPVFEVQIPSVNESFDYRMRIGRALTRRFRVEAVPPPAFNEVACTLEPPSYTGLLPTQYVGAVEMAISAPVGTRANVKASLNREMDSLLLFDNGRTISPGNNQPKDIAEFRWMITTNKATSWTISLTDSRGFTNLLTWADYEAIPDYPPDVRLTYPSGNSYVLPTYGHLKTVFDIRDDYGITNATLVMLPDNEKFPWTTEVELERVSKGIYRVVQDISLGEFMIGGVKKIRIWLEAADNLPVELGGPNVSKSRTIAVNLDNAERRSLADQVRIPERDSITNLLETAAARLENAAKKLASTADNPKMKQKELDAAMEEAEKVMAEVAEKTEEAEKKADKGLFAGVADKLENVSKEAVEEARKAVEEIPLTEETERKKIVEEAVEKMNKAAEEARSAIPEILEKDALLKKASDLETLAAKEAALAKKAKERQLTDEELLDWQAKQKELANQFGALENITAEREDIPKSFIPEENKAKPQAETGKKSDDKESAKNNDANASQSESRKEPAKTEGVKEKPKASPKAAAEAAIKAAEAAKGKPKDEAMLKNAREAEAAAKESKRAAAESQRAKAALSAIEKDREALKEIAEKADELKKAAEKVADDAFNVRMEQVRYEAEKVDPELAKADKLSQKATKLAEMVEKAAQNPEAVSPAKLEAAADEVTAMAEELSKSQDPVLKRAADLAKEVARSAKETALQNQDKVASDKAKSDGREGEQSSVGNNDGSIQEVDKELADAEDEVKAATTSEHAKKTAAAIKDELKKTAESTREQAFRTARESEKLAGVATNLAARLDNAVKNAQQAASPNGKAQAQGKSAEKAKPGSVGQEDLESLYKEADSLAKAAEKTMLDAQDATKRANNKAERRNSDVANRAKNTASEAKQAAESVKKAIDAMPKQEKTNTASNGNKNAASTDNKNSSEAPKPPSREALAETERAKRAASIAQKYALENKVPSERLAKTSPEHAIDAVKAAERAVDLAKALSDKMQPANGNNAKSDSAETKGKSEKNKASSTNKTPIPEKPDEIRKELGKAIEDAKKAALSAKELSRDTNENLPDMAATMVEKAMSNAENIAKNYDALTPPPGRPKANKDLMAKNSDIASKNAQNLVEAAQRFAEAANATPEQHAKDYEELRRNIGNDLERLSKDIRDAAISMQRDMPHAATNAHAKANIDGAKKAIEKYAAEAKALHDNLASPIDDIPRLVDNANRLGRYERQKATNQGMEDIEITPSELASKELGRLRDEFRWARAKASDLMAAERYSNNPDALLRIADAADKRLSEYMPGRLSKEMTEKRGQSQSGETQGDKEPLEESEEDLIRESNSSNEDEAPFENSDAIASATGETRALANRLAESREHTKEAQDALELGDAKQAREVAKEAAAAAANVAKKAAASESARNNSAKMSQARSQQSAASATKRASNLINKLLDEAKKKEAAQQKAQNQTGGGSSAQQTKQQTGGGGGKSQEKDEKSDEPKEFKGERPPEVDVPLFDEFLGGLTEAASNIVAAAAIADESPQEANRLAEAAIREALKLQAPSEEQVEAARLANLASQDLRRLAAETAELAGLDPETMKIKKPANHKPDKQKESSADKKKKAARTFIEGGGGDNEPKEEEIEVEFEDGISLEMPEWLKRLGFPISEWLKYKGSLESGLPDSALEHVAPEYRNLVREYFKLLSKEK